MASGPEIRNTEQAGGDAAVAGQLVFEGFVLDPVRFELRGLHDGAAIRLQPKTFDVLLYLVRHRGRVIDKDELLSQLWPGVVVTEHSLTRCIKDIRKALGDAAQAPRFVETVSRRGYRWLAEVQALTVAAPLPAGGAAGGSPAVATVGKAPAPRMRAAWWLALFAISILAGALGWQAFRAPATQPSTSIAVLPFVNHDDPAAADVASAADAAYFAHGLSEDLIGLLAQVPRLQVAARSSAFAFQGAGHDARTLGRKLGVRWLLEGTVRRDGEQLRVAVQLVDAHSGFQVWSARYERSRGGLFAMQDEIARAVVDQVALRLDPGAALPDGHRSASVAAHEAFLLGRDLLNRRPINWAERAREAFATAIERDPGFARAHAGLAMVAGIEALRRADGAQHAGRAEASALRAIELDPRLGMAHAALGLVQMNRGELVAAEASLRRAIELEPVFGPAYNWLHIVLNRQGRPAEAAQVLQQGLRADPLNAVLLENLGVQLTNAGRHEEAREVWERALGLPTRPIGAVIALLSQAQAQGRLADAMAYAHMIDTDGRARWGALSALPGAVVLLRLGLPEDALQRLEPVLSQAGPLTTGSLHDLERLLRRLGRASDLATPVARAVAAAERAGGSLPPWLAELQLRSLVLAGAAGEAQALRLPPPPDPRPLAMDVARESLETQLLLAWAQSRAGQTDAARERAARVLALIDADPARIQAPLRVTQATAALLTGQRERALALMELARQEGWNDHLEVETDPRWQSLRAEPRLVAVLEQARSSVAAQRQLLRERLAQAPAGALPALRLP